MSIVLTMPMSIVDIIHMITMLDGFMSTALAVDMLMILMNLAAHFH
ncbi:hypothetical protein [Corynebacterium mustelae]|nr:hypothetical protein [Corynebacterium mustelae]